MTQPKRALPAPRILLLAAVAACALALAGFALWSAFGTPDLPAFPGKAQQEEAWLVADYGFQGDRAGDTAIVNINTPMRALRMLELLDRRLPAAGPAVIPADLAEALEQIRSVAPALAEQPAFRRLEALARARRR